MESVSPPPTKKTRYLKHIEFPVTECRREFKLPQQFPSMAPSPRSAVPNGKSATNPANPTCVLRNVPDKASNEALAINAVKKLRIRSQDGKDLGEIKVRFLSQDDALASKTGVFAKSSIGSKINKPVKFSIMPLETADSLSTLRQNSKGSPPSLKLSPTKALSGSSIEKLLQRPIGLSRASSVPDQSSNGHNRKLIRKETILCMNDNAPKYARASLTPQLEAAKNRNLLVSKTDDLNNTEKLKLTEGAREIVNRTSNVESEHWQLAKSKFPVVKCEKLMIPRNKININDLFKVSKNVNNSQGNSADVQSKAIEETKAGSGKTLGSARLGETAECIQAGLMNSAMPKEPSTIVQDSQNKTKPPNCSATGDRNTTTADSSNAHRREYALQPAPRRTIHNNEAVSSSNEETGSSRNAQKKDPGIQNTISSTNNVEDAATSLSEKEKQSQHWGIIKEALISVKDKDLRSKALQALADCGIGIAKQVPMIPPEEQRTIHDSQVQTDVFGLLDLESFVLVTKESPALERIKQTVRSSPSTPINAERSAQPSANKRSNYIDNIDLLPLLSPMSYVEDDIGIESCLNEFLSASTEASKVNRILSTPHSLYKKVAFQLQKDVEGIQQPDENGLLNIHRAVVQNNLNELQRLLLVLNASKISIDVFTEDRMSCLEVAVKSKASRELVHVLLQAGAKPVSTELLHDSAVLLASKLSSPILPDLLLHVADSKSLNQVDSAGLAPLHYCVLHSNLEGVIALVEAGADVNLRDNRSGRTAFFHALEHNRITIAQKLLEYGAIANLPNFSGQSVLSLMDDSKSLSLKSALKQIVS